MAREEVLLLVGPLYRDLEGAWLKPVPTDAGVVIVLGPKARAQLGLGPIKVNVAAFEDQLVRRRVYRHYRAQGYAFRGYRGTLATFQSGETTLFVAAQHRNPRARTVRGWLDRYRLHDVQLDVWSLRPDTLAGVAAKHPNVKPWDLRCLK